MKYFYVLILVTLGISPAHAKWNIIGETDSFTAYADFETKRVNNDIAQMWFLYQFKNEQVDSSGNKYLSSKNLFEFDCKNEQLRILAMVDHAEKMGEGKLVFIGNATNSSAPKWKHVAPDALNNEQLKLACSKN